MNTLKSTPRAATSLKSVIVLGLLVLLVFGSLVRAASVTPSGYSTTFSSVPAVTDWATLSRAGGAADVYDSDLDVNTNVTAAAVSTALTSSGSNPVASGLRAAWSSLGQNVQTRPTGNRYSILMGKFVNNSGSNATELAISYTLDIAAAAVAEDAGKGTRLYYSLSGEFNTWTNLPSFNTTATNGIYNLSTNLSVLWTNNGALYLAWIDDNGAASGTEVANRIDDFSIAIRSGVVPGVACAIVSPTNDVLVVTGTPVSLTAAADSGTAPFLVRYYTNSGAGNQTFQLAGTSSVPPYDLALGVLPAGTYNVYATATDQNGAGSTGGSFTNRILVADPIALNLTSPANGAVFFNNVDVIGTATVAGGTTPYSVQFYLDGVASGAPVTTAPYTRNFGPLSIADHTVHAVVTDAKNWVSNSAINSIHVDGPLSVALTPTNGSILAFDAPLTLTAAPLGGLGPYVVTFFTNGTLAGTVSTPPYALTLGGLATGTYTCLVHAVDSTLPTAQQADSTASEILLVVSPLNVALSSPTNSQTLVAGVAFSPVATASVALPLTVANVEFFFDGVPAGSDATAPYSISIPGPTVGAHTLYARATDSSGRQAYTATNALNFINDPLANNNFANRLSLTAPASVVGINTGATTEQGEPTFFFVNGQFGAWGATLWYKWVAPVTGVATIDTYGSGFNTYLSVYTGTTVNALTLVGRNDNSPTDANASVVTFTATQGVEYQIQVGGNSGFGPGAQTANGTFSLHLTMPPAVTITSPTNGSVFLATSPFTVNVDAVAVSGSIAQVELYRGTNLVGISSNAPYSFVISNAPAGTNSLIALATDTVGQIGASAVLNVLVASPGVTIISPLDGALFNGTSAIPVTAFAILPSGSITSVDFFLDGVLIGQDSEAPFSALWTSPTPGSHRIGAVGRDGSGNTYSAPPVYFGVNQSLVASNSVWKFLDDGTDPGAAWVSGGFNDTSWGSGPAPLGYSDSNGRQPLTSNSFGPDTNNKFPATYYRQSFTAANPAGLGQISLSYQRDDGIIIYLNGVEVVRNNMPAGPVGHTNYASAAANDDGGTTFTVSLSPTLLVQGDNQLAVEIHQDSANSSDIWFVMEMAGIPNIIRNEPPSVALTNPVANTSFVAPASIRLEATASDTDGQVELLEFFADGVRIGEPLNAAFAADWTNPPVGAHLLTAVATDNLQGRTTSVPVPIVVYNAAGQPVTAITSPGNGAVMEGPTNLTISASANALSSVASVEFFANGVSLATDAQAPYAAVWPSVFGTNTFHSVVTDANGAKGTSAVISVVITIPPTNTVEPYVAAQSPARFATVSTLTNILVTFTERVQGVNAGDLTINGIPAAGVTGSGSNYVFSFPQPPYGEVEVTFISEHGITDYGFPLNLEFDELGVDASWEYQLVDTTAPAVFARTPAAGSTVTNLPAVSVTFSELVTGVDASDLLVNGTAAFAVAGSGSNYVFNVFQPSSGTVTISWATNHGILDTASNSFIHTAASSTWNFTLDSRTTYVPSNSVWKYFKGLGEASSPSNAWRQLAFDDSAWLSGAAPFVYGEPGFTNSLIPGTDVSDMASNAYSSVFFRRSFVVTRAGAVTNLFFNHRTDDGFIAWINGVQVFRYNMPAGGDQPYNGSARTNATETGGNNGVPFVVAAFSNVVAALVTGTNQLAIQAFNYVTNPASADFAFEGHLYAFLPDDSFVPPRVASVSPAQGDVFALSNLTVNFTEGVTNVHAGDLLVNGVPASGVSSSNGVNWTFTFAQPAFGPVLVTWVSGHGILDLDEIPKPFDGTAASARFSYYLANPSGPVITAKTPAASTTVTGLTSITVTFGEPVTGVDAADLLIAGQPAAGLVAVSPTNYTFTFTQPAYGVTLIRFATNNGITDLETPANDFDRTRPAHQWFYNLVDPVPTVSITTPTNNTYALPPASVVVTASAADNDGSVARVDFYSNGGKIGESATAPYTFSWTGVPLGSYLLTAVATDNQGLSRTSAPSALHVVSVLPVSLLRGPYLNSGTSTGGVVRWRTDLGSDTVLRYGTDPTELNQEVVINESVTEHIVRLRGLLPNTKYFYSFGTSVQVLGGGDTNHWFRTPPVPGTRQPLRFWVLGDPGTANNNQRAVRDAYYSFAATNRPADFWIMLGDNAYNSGTDSEFQSAVFEMYPAECRNLFLYPTLGNHETAQATTIEDFPYLNIFSFPMSGEAGGVPSGSPRYFSYDYGNVHFVSLDSMTQGQGTTNSAMFRWLVNDLTATTQEWKIVYFHHPPYTKGSHNSDTESDLIAIRQNWNPVLERLGVDLVLNGHSHSYERSYLIRGHYGLSTTFTPAMRVDAGDGRVEGTGAYAKTPQTEGVVYSVVGSSGQIGGGTLNHPAYFSSMNELGSAIVDVSGNRLDMRFINSAGNTRDQFTILKGQQTGQLAIGSIAQFSGGTNVVVTFEAQASVGYTIEQSTGLGGWQRLQTFGAMPTNRTVRTTLPALDPTRFYRLRSP